MKRGKEWLQHMTESLELHDLSLPGIPLVELSGNSRVLIENHCGIIRYSRNKICVKVNCGSVGIEGDDLILSGITPGQLVIRGKIRSIFVGGGEDHECAAQ